MNRDIEHFNDSLPDFITPNQTMEKPNEVLVVYEGEFQLRKNEINVTVIGVIEFRWFPFLGVYFKGESAGWIMGKLYNESGDLSIYIKEDLLGVGFLTKQKFGDITEIEGVFKKHCIVNDQAIPVDEVKFSIPNMNEFYGGRLKNKLQFYVGRLELNGKKHSLTLDKLPTYRERSDSLSLSGGYHILYSGQLKFQEGINHGKLDKYIHIVNCFLSFINGRKVSGLFYNGVHNGEIVWKDFTNYKIDPYKPNRVWSSNVANNNVKGFEIVYNQLHNLWRNENDKNFIESAIYWYVEVNQSSSINSAMIIAQTILELLYNYIVIEKEKIIKGKKDSENLSAANKIRLLLSRMQVGYDASSGSNELQEFIDNNSEVDDAVDAIVQYRNAIVHSQLEKRKKVFELTLKFKYEALHTALWYIELSLLYVLKYEGNYFNRIDGTNSKLPWKG